MNMTHVKEMQQQMPGLPTLQGVSTWCLVTNKVIVIVEVQVSVAYIVIVEVQVSVVYIIIHGMYCKSYMLTPLVS